MPKNPSALRQGANLLILVDQFEEFFTNEENYVGGVASPLAQITVNLLSETIRLAQRDNLPIWVIFTMRSDYIGQCVAFHGFAELIGESTYFVPRLTREEFQAVIEKPAENNGDPITARLTQRLLNDLGDGIDQLPVLQHALHRIWHAAREGKETMDLIHYALVGGLALHKLPETDRPLFEKYLATLPAEEAAFYQQGRSAKRPQYPRRNPLQPLRPPLRTALRRNPPPRSPAENHRDHFRFAYTAG